MRQKFYDSKLPIMATATIAEQKRLFPFLPYLGPISLQPSAKLKKEGSVFLQILSLNKSSNTFWFKDELLASLMNFSVNYEKNPVDKNV